MKKYILVVFKRYRNICFAPKRPLRPDFGCKSAGIASPVMDAMASVFIGGTLPQSKKDLPFAILTCLL